MKDIYILLGKENQKIWAVKTFLRREGAEMLECELDSEIIRSRREKTGINNLRNKLKLLDPKCPVSLNEEPTYIILDAELEDE